MNKHNPLLALGAALLLAPLICTTTQGQTWETVDQDGIPNTYAGIAADSDGRVFAVGWERGTSFNYWAIVRRSRDGGLTWETTYFYPQPTTNSQYSYFNKVTTDSLGTTYVVGNARPQGGEPHINEAWVVWRSLDHGDTWTLVDEQIPGQIAEARSVATDTAGNVYVAGILNTRRTGAGWSVRKGVPDPAAPNGLRWTQIDNYQLQKSYNSQAYAVATRKSPVPGQPDEIYVGGEGSSRAGGFWTVRRSRDGGITWTTVASYQMVKNSGNNFAKGFAISTTGEIYASGRISTSTSGSYFWIVRKSSDGGTTWANVDVFNPAGALGSMANEIAVDSFGRVFAVGTDWKEITAENTSMNKWIVRASTDGGANWTTTEYFPGVAHDVAADSFGNVYVTGGSASGIATRKLAAPAQ